MKVVVPMAGFGDRFIKAGYKDPKPLIEINGKRIIEYVVEMFDRENDEFVFICNETHIAETNMSDVLKSLVNKCTILTCPPHKMGPVYTLSKAFALINDDEPIIVSYCDNPFVWNYNHFKDFATSTNSDGIILTHRGAHPHSLNSTKMAFCKTEGDDLIEIKEKECYTNNHLQEHASTGMYYFKSGKILKKYCNELMDLDINYNGEYYVTLVYNLLVRDKLKVKVYDSNDVVFVFGTPEEVASFKAWKAIIDGGQLNSGEYNVIKIYRYWKDYYDKQQ